MPTLLHRPDPSRNADLERWIALRPPAVRRIAEALPPGTLILIESEPFFVLGYEEAKGSDNVILRISPDNPATDAGLELAKKSSQPLCPHCIEDLLLQSEGRRTDDGQAPGPAETGEGSGG